MELSRRTFIGIGSLAACGAALTSASLFAAPTRVLKGGLPQVAGDQAALAFASSYCTNLRVVGASVLGRIRTSGMRALHIIAEVSDLEKLAAALPSAPFAGVYATENTLSFSLPEVDVTVENLVPAAFAARLASMAKRSGNVFAYDALSYDPATQRLTDPFNARVGGVRVVNKTLGAVSALAVALRGMVEGAQLRLGASADFTNWKVRVVRQIAKSKDAAALAENFYQNLATLADHVPPSGVEALVRSRLVATALQQAQGIEAGAGIVTYRALRLAADPAISNAAIWVAALAGRELQSGALDGAATTALQQGTRTQVISSRLAVAQARTLVTHASFPVL